jgi:DivIVA domain-containing protein
MAVSPQSIRELEFKPARRGYDQDEVDRFRAEVADALEAAQNEATAMEARARAAVARLQELSKAAPRDPTPDAGPAPARPAVVKPSVDESETISRTLLLAQRTADTTVAEARAEADRLLTEAREEAEGQLASSRADAERVVEEAREEARRAGESERVRVEGEVQALLARRDFLESDVDHLEQFIAAQRERITEAVSELTDIVQRVPNGLADMRRPLLSAAADEPIADEEAPEAEITEITRIAESSDDDTAAGAAIDGDADRDAEDVAVDVDANGDGEGAPGSTSAAAEDETGDVWAQRDGGGAAVPAEAAEAAETDAVLDPDQRS